MYSKAKIFGLPIHPMLVSFPIVFYTTAFFSFIIYQSSYNPFWFKVAFIGNLAGVISAVAAAIPGIIDLYWGVPQKSEARRKGLNHAILNVGALLIFAINLIFIWGSFDLVREPQMIHVFLSGFGFLATVFGSYLGHGLVSRNKLGVELNYEQEQIQKNLESGRSIYVS